MRSCLAAAAVAIACQAAFAQPDDRAHSAACRQALEALQAQEAVAVAASSPQGNPRQQAARKRLPALQREAATACLGGGRAERRSPPAGARVSPPVSVAPVTVMPPPALPQGGPPALAPPPPPLTVTACDAAGCLASDGTRLQWAGPNLLGPRGMCTVQGSLLQCP
jgi:hypothetical protein